MRRLPTLLAAAFVAAGTIHVAVARSCEQPTKARGVASYFVRTAVFRHHTGCSYPYATRSLRSHLTPRQWATGNIPVIPFIAHNPQGVNRRVAASARRMILKVWLWGGNAGFVGRLYLVRHGGWKVDYWGSWNSPGAPG